MAQTGPGDLRRVLHQMRRVMAAEGAAQDRLNQLVKVIAAEMVAEVCSVYVMRAGEVLELFATEGLKAEAVHRTRLQVDEGLVGTVAATASALSLAEAEAHPKFAYRPETGEEIYHSFLGVPILRGGRVRGVLVIQNRALRRYTEDEAEALEIIATVLAELIAGGDLVPSIEQVTVQGNALLPHRLEGVRINGGIAMGEAVLHQPRVPIPELLAEDPAHEHARLATAVAAMHRALDQLLARPDLQSGGEHRDILDAYRMFAEDQGWLRRIREAIDSGLTAEAAVQKVEDDTRTRMNLATDPYLRERLYDLEDLASRLLQHLAGGAHTAAKADLPAEFVLIARRMGPAELLDYDPRRIRALVLEEGSSVSHVAIVARTLDIPVVGQVKDVLSRVDLHDPVIVDGDNALVFLRAGEDVQQMAAESIAVRRRRREAYAAMRDLPAVTRDGVAVSLQLNAGLLMDLAHLDATGAEGVGLYRTEIPFMVRPEMPTVEAQTELYRSILQQSGGRPVRFRTLDIGGDKKLPYLREAEEDNPAMGWRALRLALDRPILLRRQLRALLRASAGRELEVMFPMVADVDEFAAARRMVERERAAEAALAHALPRAVKIGAMVEVPALLWQLPALLAHADFVSVGSNDLFQFLYAIDRGNPRVADRYDILSPGVFALLGDLVEHCRAATVSLALCGEMGGRPLEAMALIGLGFRTLSMTPAAIGPVKAMIRSLDVGALARYLRSLKGATEQSLRQRLKMYARDHGVLIEDA